ncbi:hypothetical protein FHX76_002553 [Lysinibacter cavernae]|uniref:Uncharacterized protein n=1 Tax=Lysinibacter cavernae TaxID=1640652 RepID=A0A7X5R352_9MICO|nr:hypothetical protein [Lysinibacter cavernae]
MPVSTLGGDHLSANIPLATLFAPNEKTGNQGVNTVGVRKEHGDADAMRT